MTVAWTDFLAIAVIITELVDAIANISPEPQRSKLAQTRVKILRFFKIKKQKHDAVRKAAKKYRKYYGNPDVAELMEAARIVLKMSEIFNQDFEF